MTNRVKPWTVRGSRYLIRERWLTARIDDCVTPTGVEVQRSRKSRREDFVIVALGRKQMLASRLVGLHHQPLSERCVNLSIHTAPIRQTYRSCQPPMRQETGALPG